MNDLASLYQDQGKHVDAEPLYKEVLAGHQKALGLEHPNTLTSMNNLAFLYQDQGKYADAEPLYKEALVGCQKALGLEHPDTLTSMNNLASLYCHQGKYADAEPLYKEAPTRRCEFDLLFYNSQSQANWSRKNGQALPAVHGEISNTEI